MFKDFLKGPASGVLVGVGLALLAPIVLPVLAKAARPLAKAALHGYFALVDELKSLAADDDKKDTPVLGQLVAAGVEQAASAAGEEVAEVEVADAIVEGVVTILEVV
ncbi:MAG: hypothetical protein ACOZFS_01070 [Thermodesulfobacteriota bacterium]